MPIVIDRALKTLTITSDDSTPPRTYYLDELDYFYLGEDRSIPVGVVRSGEADEKTIQKLNQETCELTTRDIPVTLTTARSTGTPERFTDQALGTVSDSDSEENKSASLVHVVSAESVPELQSPPSLRVGRGKLSASVLATHTASFPSAPPHSSISSSEAPPATAITSTAASTPSAGKTSNPYFFPSSQAIEEEEERDDDASSNTFSFQWVMEALTLHEIIKVLFPSALKKPADESGKEAEEEEAEAPSKVSFHPILTPLLRQFVNYYHQERQQCLPALNQVYVIQTPGAPPQFISARKEEDLAHETHITAEDKARDIRTLETHLAIQLSPSTPTTPAPSVTRPLIRIERENPLSESDCKAPWDELETEDLKHPEKYKSILPEGNVVFITDAAGVEQKYYLHGDTLEGCSRLLISTLDASQEAHLAGVLRTDLVTTEQRAELEREATAAREKGLPVILDFVEASPEETNYRLAVLAPTLASLMLPTVGTEEDCDFFSTIGKEDDNYYVRYGCQELNEIDTFIDKYRKSTLLSPTQIDLIKAFVADNGPDNLPAAIDSIFVVTRPDGTLQFISTSKDIETVTLDEFILRVAPTAADEQCLRHALNQPAAAPKSEAEQQELNEENLAALAAGKSESNNPSGSQTQAQRAALASFTRDFKKYLASLDIATLKSFLMGEEKPIFDAFRAYIRPIAINSYRESLNEVLNLIKKSNIDPLSRRKREAVNQLGRLLNQLPTPPAIDIPGNFLDSLKSALGTLRTLLLPREVYTKIEPLINEISVFSSNTEEHINVADEALRKTLTNEIHYRLIPKVCLDHRSSVPMDEAPPPVTDFTKEGMESRFEYLNRLLQKTFAGYTPSLFKTTLFETMLDSENEIKDKEKAAKLAAQRKPWIAAFDLNIRLTSFVDQEAPNDFVAHLACELLTYIDCQSEVCSLDPLDHEPEKSGADLTKKDQHDDRLMPLVQFLCETTTETPDTLKDRLTGLIRLIPISEANNTRTWYGFFSDSLFGGQRHDQVHAAMIGQLETLYKEFNTTHHDERLFKLKLVVELAKYVKKVEGFYTLGNYFDNDHAIEAQALIHALLQNPAISVEQASENLSLPIPQAPTALRASA